MHHADDQGCHAGHRKGATTKRKMQQQQTAAGAQAAPATSGCGPPHLQHQGVGALKAAAVPEDVIGTLLGLPQGRELLFEETTYRHQTQLVPAGMPWSGQNCFV